MKRKMPALNALKAFEVAGSTASFTRAAELPNVTQSAVSLQVVSWKNSWARACWNAAIIIWN